MSGIKNFNNDSIEKMIKLFKKQVEKTGILGDVKKHLVYEKPSLARKKKSIAARKQVMKQARRNGL